MSKASKWDGVYQRPDSPFWWCSFTDASGKRTRRKLAGAHTRTQATKMLGAIRVQEEKARTLGVRPASEITTEALFERYKRHQKARIRPTPLSGWAASWTHSRPICLHRRKRSPSAQWPNTSKRARRA